MSETTERPTERHEFSAEVGRLLDLVVHALYSDREIFLRELVANAADAVDRRRFEALTNPALAPASDARVRIVPDKAARTLAIEDSGVGMSREELGANLGTIARSGTRAFGQAMAEAKPEDRVSLIGQFGVGFYSAFMVADRVEVTSRRAGTDEAWTWASDGGGAYTVAPGARDAAGTTVLLHLKPDADEYLEPLRIETVVRKWADGITVPIVLAAAGEDGSEGGENRPINEGTALWRKPKAEVAPEAYTAFYRTVGHTFDEPWAVLHWRAEGALEFSALLMIPGMRPFDAVDAPRESRVRLHVRRMFITDEAGLLPPWLRFVVGVVDTEDLPLNISREMLQVTPVLARIRKAVTSRVLSEIKGRAKEPEGYNTFWEAFGPVLKEGVWEDQEHRAELAPLLRFQSSAAEGWTSLPEYVGRMREGQDAVYFLAGDDVDALRGSPQLEGFRARGIEVLLLADTVDAFWPERLREFDGKPLRSITQAGDALAKHAPEAAPNGEPADVGKLLPALKAALGDAVSDVRATDRLVGSAVVLAAQGWGPDLQMQRLMRRRGGAAGAGLGTAVLECNPRHPLIRALAARADAGEEVSEAAETLLDLARVQDGEAPRDPAAFARRVTEALAGAA